MKVTDMIYNLASSKGMYKKQEVRVAKVRKNKKQWCTIECCSCVCVSATLN